MLEYIETLIGTGLMDIFGNPLFLGLLGMFFIIALGLALRFSIDTIILGVITMSFILAGTLLPQWFFYMVIIGAAFLVGFMIVRLIRK